MHAALHLSLYWAVAFGSLVLTLALLNIFDNIIGNDLVLHSVGKEAVIAGVASLIEGGSFWVIVFYARSALRALIVPVLIVGLFYKLAHLEDWSKNDAVMLLVFQAGIIFVGAALFAGNFKEAIVVLAVFGAVLGLIAAFARSL
ncbi:MAG TPA: hypothetical protein VFC44_23385 [Candidatus Saccharimonadales bacterium]|nr:hypothetical protein [Candidatus Saccharimonadales bacterium]